MRNVFRGSVRLMAGALLVSPLLLITMPAFAQQKEAPEDIAARKAALVIEGRGVVQCKTTAYSFQIEFSVEKAGGKNVVLAEYQQRQDALKEALTKVAGSNVFIPTTSPELAMRLGDSYHTSGIAADVWDRPAAVIRAKGVMGVSADSKAKADRIFETLRSTGVTGTVKVFHEVSDGNRYRPAALKAAVADVQQRVQTLSEAAKPKEFELLFVKEGDFEFPSIYTYATIEGKQPLRLSETIEAVANLTMYYTLRPATVAKAIPAGKALTKPGVPSRTPKAAAKPVTPVKGKN